VILVPKNHYAELGNGTDDELTYWLRRTAVQPDARYHDLGPGFYTGHTNIQA
jgi:hypothetical protein